ncbi:hypothetical protein TI04_09360 [Achromatium sp. WMS2]|nr:hypothetical protein TI04_09360 [Achromatium sp. WMS2]
MARVTVEDCLDHVNNRFDLVLMAAKRARLIAQHGYEPMVLAYGDKPTVIALREIAAGLVNPVQLEKDLSNAKAKQAVAAEASRKFIIDTSQPF